MGKPAAAKAKTRERTDLEKAIADAIAMKTSYSTAELDSKRLPESMTSDKSYKKEQLAYFEELTELTAKMAAAKESQQFFKDFILKDLVDIKKRYDEPNALISSCVMLQDALEGPASAVTKKVKGIMRVVRARMEPTKPPAAKKARVKN